MGRSNGRLAVFSLLVASMIVVLIGRTVQLQASDPVAAAAAVSGNTLRTEQIAATRGVIVDQAGRPLAANRQQLQVAATLDTLFDLPRDGADVVDRLAGVLGLGFAEVDALLTPCSSDAAIPDRCWNGSLADPVPVVTGVPLETVLPIVEQPERFPGVQVATITSRFYPSPAGERAGHLLGRLGSVSPEELAQQGSADGGYGPGDVVGRGGLEQQYEAELRGTPGARTVSVDTAGRVVRVLREQEAVAGATLVTSIDAKLQALVEQQLVAAVERAREQGYAGDGGAAVVVDVTNGRALAMASYPDYSPAIFEGGIAEQDYQALLDSGALLFAPVQGEYPPGSTFKPFTTAGMAAAGFELDGAYPCPGAYRAGGRTFTNYESAGYGTISLQRALEVSCNTVFYRAADQIWSATGGQRAGAGAADPVHATATGFGLGTPTGIDLPGEAAGLVAGRSTKYQHWQDNQERWCAAAAEGYPELRRTDPELAEKYTALDAENCQSGGAWRQGDAINASIGQGLTAVSPLQMAMGYAAIANGGTRYRPQLARAVVAADGTVTRSEPHELGKVPADTRTLEFLTAAMRGVTERGTAAGAFAGFPLQEIPVAGKTGSAQVPGGKASTSWFASFAPADAPRYAVVMMVTQGGTGSATAAPSVRAIYEALFGVAGGSVDPARSILVGGAPRESLPEALGAVESDSGEGAS